jgi:hypothetical protein
VLNHLDADLLGLGRRNNDITHAQRFFGREGDCRLARDWLARGHRSCDGKTAMLMMVKAH